MASFQANGVSESQSAPHNSVGLYIDLGRYTVCANAGRQTTEVTRMSPPGSFLRTVAVGTKPNTGYQMHN